MRRNLHWFFLNPAVQYVGKVSYGIYLFHEVARVAVWTYGKPMMATWPPAVGYATRLALYLLLSVFIAALSYEFLEKRFLRLRTIVRPEGVSRPMPPGNTAQE